MIKRLFDVTCSFVALLILIPLFAIVAVLIKYDSPGPVFYRGVRVGRHGKTFRVFKFRTMRADAEKTGISSTAQDDQRITFVGSIVRKYKIDEIPQFLNILKGEMSFVGPRPQVKWATDLYTEEQKLILSVRPGLADSAFVAIPNEEEILKGSKDPDKEYMKKIHPEKTRLQIEYARNHSFWIDLKIIFKTIVAVMNKL